MKLKTKRFMAWLLTVLMLVNCVPVSADDTQYSNSISLLSDIQEYAVEVNPVSNSVTSTTNSAYTFTIPVYFYSGDEILDTTQSVTVTAPRWYGTNSSTLTQTQIAAWLTAINSDYVVKSTKVASSVSDSSAASFTGTATFTATTSASINNGLVYTYTLTNDVGYSGSSVAVFVEYEQNDVTASFELDGGTGTAEAQTVQSGESITFPEAPTKEGYTFQGWSSDGGTMLYQAGETLVLTADTTFTAIWAAAEYTVQFDANYEGAASLNGYTVSSEQSANFPALTREGYTFKGWATTQDAAEAEYAAGSAIPVAAATYYAVWETIVVTVTFDYGEGFSVETGESADTIEVEYGDTFIFPYGYRDSDSEELIYDLVAWTDGTLEYYPDEEFTGTLTEDTTYTAVWEGMYEIYLLAGDGYFDGDPDIADVSVLIPVNQKFLDYLGIEQEPTPPDGMMFSGWMDEATGSMITAASIVTGSTTLVAQYEEKNGYFVDFQLNGETIYKVLVPYDTDLLAYINANADVKTSHVISGSEVKLGAFDWTNEDGSAIEAGQIVEEDIVVTGTLGSVTVTFYNDSTKAEQIGKVVNVSYGETVSSFPAVDELTPPDGQSFVEWRYAGTEGEVKFTSSTPVYEDMEVYAYYAQMHTLTFYTDSTMTTEAGTVQVVHGELFDTSLYPEVTVPEGQTLRYWVDATTDVPVVFNPTIPVTSDMSLYPVFDKYVFVIKNKTTGDTITSVYLGAPVDFTVAADEGYYYAGLQLENGTILQTDGEYVASTTLFGVTSDPVNGQYIVYATPVFEKQLTIVYHAGDGATILAAADGQTYTQTVDGSVLMPGAMDIIRTDGTTGIAIDGWATTADATAVELSASETYTNDEIEALDTDGDGIVHLYPVWTQAEGTVAVTFVSNYPDGAVDADGNALTAVSYTIYIKSGSYPVMPTLEQAGMTMPSNTYEDDDGNTVEKYTLSGWSIMQSGEGDSDGTVNGVYVTGSQYQSAIEADTTFYAIWIDDAVSTSAATAAFFIRADGLIPQEPGGYTASSYYPTGDSHTLTGTIKEKINIVNDPAKVELNLLTKPTASEILSMLSNQSLSGDWSKSGSTIYYREVELTTDNYGTGSDDVWYVEWYACKLAGTDHWHVDGRIRFVGEYTVTYWPNGGTSATTPAAETHKASETVTVQYANGDATPTRAGYTFVGWSTDPNTTWQEVESDTSTQNEIYKQGVDTSFTMPAANVNLYAIWKPDTLTLTFDGIKYMVEKGVISTASDAFSFLVEKQNADGTYSTVKTVTNSTSDGTFSFDYEFDSTGLYTFRVTEVKGSDTNIAYDGAVYTITVYIGSDDQGLYEVGRTVMKNNVIQSDKTMEFTNRVGERIVTVTKVWEDNNDQDGIRPSSITVYLYADGVPNSETKVLDDSNGWSATWTQLPIAADNQKITYTVQEVTSLIGYTSTTTGDMDAGFTITNTYTPLETQITVTKEWVDNSNAVQIRPDEIDLTLIGSDGSTRTATLTGEGDSWTYTFSNLPVYYGGGNRVTYTLDETDVPEGYTKAVNGYKVTNTLSSDYSFTVNKNVDGNFASRDKTFEFTVEILAADGTTVVDTETFSLAHGGTYTVENIPYGAYVRVTEDPDDYTPTYFLGMTSYNGASYTTTSPITNSEQGVTFLNTKNVTIDTGVDLDGLPYILLLLGAAGVAVIWWLLLCSNKKDD